MLIECKKANIFLNPYVKMGRITLSRRLKNLSFHVISQAINILFNKQHR